MDSDIIKKYEHAKIIVMCNGYDNEVIWQSNINIDDIDESTFLKEVAWVILSSGMRERVIRNIFSKLSNCFYNWKSANIIYENKINCINKSIQYFNNPSKIQAIIDAAAKIRKTGFQNIIKTIKENPIEKLMEFSYIGPVTAYHLAKNIGLNVAKPDRHLVRIANLLGYTDVQLFCFDISRVTGDKISVVDIVFWRYATIEKDYLIKLSMI